MATKAKVKILVVEDNPAVLELLRQALEGFGEVVTATDGAEALLKAVEEPPDLIVSDYAMPALDGRKLFEKLRARDQTKSIPFIFMAGQSDIEEKLRPFTEGVEDYVAKPFFVREAAARAKKVCDRLLLEKLQTQARRPGVIEGLLAEMSMIDLFQSLEMGQKSCRLVLTQGGDKCEIFFDKGQVCDAVSGSVVGDDAVYKIAGWTEGTFEIDFSGQSSERRTTKSTQGLLMEAMRLLDEASRDQVGS